MSRENKTKYAILGVLANRPGSGYDIKKLFEDYIGKFWSESYGQIYPITKELESEGLAVRTVEKTEGKPDRHVFSITDKGLSELKDWLRKPPAPQKERLEVLLKLICGSHVSIEDNIELVNRFKEEWTNHIESYSEIENTLRSTVEDNAQLSYFLMAVNCGMYLGRAYIAWCDETLAALQAMQQDENKVQPED